MTKIRRFLPGPRGGHRRVMSRAIGIVVFPSLQLLDATGPASVLEVATRFAPAGRGYATALLSVRGGAIRSSGGIVVATRALRGVRALDTLVVVGGQGTRAAASDRALLAFVRRVAPRCRRIASVCTGAFVLAAAGLLRGRRATTHWRHAATLARAYPDVAVEPDWIWVRDGKVWTSAGVTAGIDLALALIADDLGEDIARQVAQELVVYYQRPGGQSQFSALLELGRPEGAFTPLLAYARAHVAEPLSVDRLAARAGMSPRNFARVFAASVGVTPAKAIERLRLEAARHRVETSTASLDDVARATGFGGAERMRRAFVRAFGQPPQALRRASRA